MSLSIDQAVTRNLPPNVDVIWNRQHPTRVLGNEIIQVQPASFLSPINACSTPEQGWRQKVPTTSPKILIALSPPNTPGGGPKSCMPSAFVHRNGSSEGELSQLVVDSPITWPRSLMASALLKQPPSVPRSCIPSVLVQRKAW